MPELLCEVAGIAVRITAGDEAAARTLLDGVAGQVYGVRLPRARFTARSDLEVAATVRCEVDGGAVTLAVTGDVDLLPVATTADLVRWDFWKLLAAVLPHLLLRRGVLTLHAACVRVGGATWLLPGGSGAGKSTLAFLARARGADVLASERAFVRDGALVAGNCVLSVAPEALTDHGVPLVGDEAALDGHVVTTTDEVATPLPLTGVPFPAVRATGPARHRTLGAAVVQRRLYDNALGQLRAEGVRSADGAPIALATPVEDVVLLARETATLAALGGCELAGTAQSIWAALAEG